MEDLELVLHQKVKPIVDEATLKHLGVSIDKLTDDITSKLSRTTLVDIEADTSLPYKEAKKKFKKAFLTKLLLLNLGNISEVARITGQNRRSIHRLIKVFSIKCTGCSSCYIKIKTCNSNSLNTSYSCIN